MNEKTTHLVVCLNPTLQKTVVLNNLSKNQVNRCKEVYTDASGKGVNVARMLTQLGEECVHLTHAGGPTRDYFLSLAGEDGLSIRWVESSSEIRMCYTLLDAADHSTTEVVEEASPVGEPTEEALVAAYVEELANVHTVIISGSKADGYSSGLFPNMCGVAKKAGCRLILDYRGADLLASLKHSPDVIKPNLMEFCGSFFPDMKVREHEQLSASQRERIEEKMSSLYEEFGTLTVLTMGGEGVLFFDGEKASLAPAKEITPVNTIGCGDAVSAGLAAGLARGEDLASAVARAQETAAQNALHLRPGRLYNKSTPGAGPEVLYH